MGKSTLFRSMLEEVYRISINNKLIVKGINQIVYINEMKILLAMNFFYLKNIWFIYRCYLKLKLHMRKITAVLSEVELLQYEHNPIKDLS